MPDLSATLDGTNDPWPDLPLDSWQDTSETLHRWTQIIGKIRLKFSPMINHWWQVPFYVTTCGLTTSPMFYGPCACEAEFDFHRHEMRITTERGDRRIIALAPRPVADFYAETMSAFKSLGIDAGIWTTPVEVADRTPFEKDYSHRSYNSESANSFWRTLVQADRVFKQFRSRFLGKASPVHFFWGSFDLAVTRFSGRRAPEHPGAPNVARFVAIEAYSHEVSSCGFWPGSGLGIPAFYSYSYKEPEGFNDCPVRPEAAYYNRELGEFILPYDVVRRSGDPDRTLLSFLQTTYDAAAETGKWDRAGLERQSNLT